MNIEFSADFDGELMARVARTALSDAEAQKLIADTVKAQLSEGTIASLIKSSAEAAIISTVRGYFTHGEGRRIVDAAVMRVVHESPLMAAIEKASKGDPK